MPMKLSYIIVSCLIFIISVNICISAGWEIAEIGANITSNVNIADNMITIKAATDMVYYSL